MSKESAHLDCKHCRMRDIKQNNSEVVAYFEVPVKTLKTKDKLLACLRCSISENSHQVELISTIDDKHKPLYLDDDLLDDVIRSISSIESKHLCGTQGLCPEQLVASLKNLHTSSS